MYIIVNKETHIIVGTAVRKVSTIACDKNGQKVYEIPDHEFHIDMIGSKLEKFDGQNQEI